MRKKTVPLLYLVLFLMLICGCSNRALDMEQVSPEQKIVIKFSHVVAENTPKGLAAQKYAGMIRERTKGRVEVQVFPNSTLYADGEEMQALQDGAVQIIAPATSKLGAHFPYWQVLDLPFAFSDTNAVHRTLEGPVGHKLTESLEKQGFKALAYWDNGFKQLTNNSRPIVVPDDLSGLKFRVMINSSVLQKQFRILGALPTPMPFKDIYMALEKNEIDGQENTISNIYSKKFYQVQKYMTMTNHGYLGYVVIVNKEFWEGLPEDIRLVMEDTLAEVTEWERTVAAQINELDYQQIKENKEVEITNLSPSEMEAWQSALEPLYVNFANEISQDLVNELISQKRDRQNLQ